MRVVTQEQFGGPEVLEIREVPAPSPRPTEVLVRVLATSVNPVDLGVRSGGFPILGEPPFVLGWDAAGVVEQISPAWSTVLRPGDEVMGMPLFPRPAGTYGERIAAPARHFVKKPADWSFEEAAALPLVGLTAWQALVDAAGVGSGQRVLVHGGGGGVGHLAVQIAKARGAEVITTASPAKHAWLRQLGADRVLDHGGDWAAGLSGLDVVLNAARAPLGRQSLDLLRPGGTLTTVVEQFDDELAAETRRRGLRFAGVVVEPDLQGLRALAELGEAGRLRPAVHAVYDLEQVAEAHAALSAGGVRGKIVLRVGSPA